MRNFGFILARCLGVGNWVRNIKEGFYKIRKGITIVERGPIQSKRLM